MMASSSSSASPYSRDEQALFHALYSLAGPNPANGHVPAANVKKFLMGASPPVEKKTLAVIWNLANESKTHSALPRDDFFRALRLLAVAQRGVAPNSGLLRRPFGHLPTFRNVHNPTLIQTVQRSSSPSSAGTGVAHKGSGGGHPAATRAFDRNPSGSTAARASAFSHKFYGIAGMNPMYCQLYQQYFQSLDPKKSGRVDGRTIKAFLECAWPQIPSQKLAGIWNVANHSRTRAALLENDFYRCLRLVALAQNGYPATQQALGDSRMAVPPPTFRGLESRMGLRLPSSRTASSLPGSGVAGAPAPGKADRAVSGPGPASNTTNPRGSPAPVDPFADLLGSGTSIPRGDGKGRVGGPISSANARPSTGSPAQKRSTEGSAPAKSPESPALGKPKPKKGQRPHFRKGAVVYYKKTNEQVRIIAPHFDDPEEVYYTIVRPNGLEKQTLASYLRPIT